MAAEHVERKLVEVATSMYQAMRALALICEWECDICGRHPTAVEHNNQDFIICCEHMQPRLQDKFDRAGKLTGQEPLSVVPMDLEPVGPRPYGNPPPVGQLAYVAMEDTFDDFDDFDDDLDDLEDEEWLEDDEDWYDDEEEWEEDEEEWDDE